MLKKLSLFNLFLKALIALALAAVLYYDLTHQNNLPEMYALFKQRLLGSNLWWLLAALTLMPFNWLTETLKWHQILKRYEHQSLAKAYQAVLAGVSFSLFTPNRVGEYGGRILFVKKRNRWKAIIINLVGNFSQILVLVSFGVLGTLYLLNKYTALPENWLMICIAFASVGIPCLAIGYFNIDVFIPLARRIPFLHRMKRYVKDISLLREFNRYELADILKWSAIRYLIYSTQYYLILRFYQIDLPVIDSFSAICAIFLLQTGIPLPPIIGLVARGNMAVQIWGMLGADSLTVLASTFTLWVINLILPALMGIILILNINLARSLGYDQE
jgi:MFS family permease